MADAHRRHVPPSLNVLKRKCLELFAENRCIIACETPILIEENGDVYDGAASLFLLPYDLCGYGSYHYLWEELQRIAAGIKAGGYTSDELEALRLYLNGMARNCEYFPRAMDKEYVLVLSALNLLH